MEHDRVSFFAGEGARRLNQSSLWDSKIELGEKFFNEKHPVPLDMNTLTALKRSSLGLDPYLWLIYHTFALRAPQRIRGTDQIGVTIATVQNPTLKSAGPEAIRQCPT